MLLVVGRGKRRSDDGWVGLAAALRRIEVGGIEELRRRDGDSKMISLCTDMIKQVVNHGIQFTQVTVTLSECVKESQNLQLPS